jgi:hypothetical protein
MTAAQRLHAKEYIIKNIIANEVHGRKTTTTTKRKEKANQMRGIEK